MKSFVQILPILRGIHSIKIALDPISQNQHNLHQAERRGTVLGVPTTKKYTLITHGGTQVKKNHWITLGIGIVIVLGIYAVPAITQQQPQPVTPTQPFYVAVIDVAQVIKQHPEFMQRQQMLQDQVKQAEATFQKRREGIDSKQKNLESSNLRAGSPEHQRAIEDIQNEVADFEKDAKAQQRRFALDNSKIMYDTYQDIKATIQRYATARGIAQVTDYRDFEPNPADPQTVAEDMDQRLVWFDNRLDITQTIIGHIYAARGMPAPSQTAAAPAGQPQPQPLR